MVLGMLGAGRYAKVVPNSIVVGFTVGIAVSIAVSNLGEVLGMTTELKGNLLSTLTTAASHLGESTRGQW
jgi:SulP family sulfate permease